MANSSFSHEQVADGHPPTDHLSERLADEHPPIAHVSLNFANVSGFGIRRGPNNRGNNRGNDRGNDRGNNRGKRGGNNRGHEGETIVETIVKTRRSPIAFSRARFASLKSFKDSDTPTEGSADSGVVPSVGWVSCAWPYPH